MAKVSVNMAGGKGQLILRDEGEGCKCNIEKVTTNRKRDRISAVMDMIKV
jgi:hypothetical protein